MAFQKQARNIVPLKGKIVFNHILPRQPWKVIYLRYVSFIHLFIRFHFKQRYSHGVRKPVSKWRSWHQKVNQLHQQAHYLVNIFSQQDFLPEWNNVLIYIVEGGAPYLILD